MKYKKMEKEQCGYFKIHSILKHLLRLLNFEYESCFFSEVLPVGISDHFKNITLCSLEKFQHVETLLN